MKSILIIILSFISFNSYAIDKNTSVQDAVLLIQDLVQKDRYKLDLNEDNVSLLYLKSWPSVVNEGLKNSLIAKDYRIADDEQLGGLIDYVDPSGEYSVSGYILRSVSVNLQSETLYVAIYTVYGGEWARETEFKLVFILDSKGNLIHLGQVE